MYYGIMNMEEQAMNFVIRKTKNKELMYIQRSFRKDGKSTTKNVERLGDLEAFMKERNMTRDEAIAWGKKRAEELTIRQKEENKEKKPDIPEKPEETRKDEVLKAKVRNLGYDIPQEHPYVISPEEFGEYDDYEKITFTYYSDGVLADDCDQMISDYDDIVGNDFYEHFGEYEQDSVYVRNDARKTDYEILLSLSSYKELLGDKPYLLSDDI